MENYHTFLYFIIGIILAIIVPWWFSLPTQRRKEKITSSKRNIYSTIKNFAKKNTIQSYQSLDLMSKRFLISLIDSPNPVNKEDVHITVLLAKKRNKEMIKNLKHKHFIRINTKNHQKQIILCSKFMKQITQKK